MVAQVPKIVLKLLDFLRLHLDHHVFLGTQIDQFFQLAHILRLVLLHLLDLAFELLVALFEVGNDADFFLEAFVVLF